jgi:hypothetical protein
MRLNAVGDWMDVPGINCGACKLQMHTAAVFNVFPRQCFAKSTQMEYVN